MSKYPAFARVTASQVSIGDTLLVRETQADQATYVLADQEFSSWSDYASVPPGQYRVAGITSQLRHGGGARRASRWYRIYLDGGYVVEVHAIQRLNWVKPS